MSILNSKKQIASWRRQLFFMLFAFCSCLFFYAVEVRAADDDLRGTVVGISKVRINLALATPLGNSGQKDNLQRAILSNISFLPFANVINPNGVPGGSTLPAASGTGLDLKRFQMAGADTLITSQWTTDSQVELRAFQPYSGQFIFGNRYTVNGDAGVWSTADKFCSELLEHLTGRGEFFRSTLAFIKTDSPKKKDVWAVRPTGRDLRRLTDIPGEALSPSWSHDGRMIVFSHIEPRTHGLGIWDATTGKTTRVKFPGNTVISPCFMPDNRIAVSLSEGKSPSIFLLNSSFQKDRVLISSSGIDVSPSVDATGTKMAFTSSRLGNPHIFLQDFKTGTVRRISQDGKYNTDPSISPDGTAVVYARMMGGGHRIFVQDLATGQETQITNGPGSDEQPKFAPDGYFIAFMSTRNGNKAIYLTTRYGGEPKMIPTGSGDASFPSWGMPPVK